MVDILLIQPPIQDFYLTRKRTIPYGLACISAQLADAGFSTQIFDSLATPKSKTISYPPEMAYLYRYYGEPDISPFCLFHHYKHFGYSFEHIGKIARESGAFLVGISSLFTPYSDMALQTAEVVKAWHPSSKVVLGGHHPTVMPEDVMNCQAVDFVLRGEGEVSMPALALSVQSYGKLDGIPGIVYRGGNGRLVVNPPAYMKNVDTFPIPDYHLIHQKYYRRHKGPSAVVVTSRGCPFECSYCCMGKASPIQYRRKSVTTVVEEIKTAVITHGVRFIDFEDENFALDRLWVTELLDRLQPLISEYPAELRAMNGLYPPSLDNAIICKMKAAGFKAVNLSLGSFCPRQLKRFGRHDFVDHFDRVVHSAVANGLDCIAYIIAGAPGQSADLSLEDLLQLSKRAVLAGLSIFYPAPGSYDYQVCLSKKILPERKTLWRSSAMPISDCSSRDETVTLMRLARILNFLKALHQNGEPLPKPYLVRNQRVNFADNRKAIGRYLLSGFLSDGKIRGCTPKGVVYEHATVDRLALRFLNEFNKSKLNQIEPAKLY